MTVMDRWQARQWVDATLKGQQTVERAELHVGNPSPDRAEVLRSKLVERRITIENVERGITSGEYGD